MSAHTAQLSSTQLNSTQTNHPRWATPLLPALLHHRTVHNFIIVFKVGSWRMYMDWTGEDEVVKTVWIFKQAILLMGFFRKNYCKKMVKKIWSCLLIILDMRLNYELWNSHSLCVCIKISSVKWLVFKKKGIKLIVNISVSLLCYLCHLTGWIPAYNKIIGWK